MFPPRQVRYAGWAVEPLITGSPCDAIFATSAASGLAVCGFGLWHSGRSSGEQKLRENADL